MVEPDKSGRAGKARPLDKLGVTGSSPVPPISIHLFERILGQLCDGAWRYAISLLSLEHDRKESQ